LSDSENALFLDYKSRSYKGVGFDSVQPKSEWLLLSIAIIQTQPGTHRPLALASLTSAR
jgi:hypothetical protein